MDGSGNSDSDFETSKENGVSKINTWFQLQITHPKRIRRFYITKESILCLPHFNEISIRTT